VRITEPAGATEELLPPGAWAALEREIPDHDGPVFVAVEDDFGLGAAIACARRSSSGGPLEVDGWVLPDWDAAIADVLALLDSWPVRRITVGAALADRARARHVGRHAPRARARAGPCRRRGNRP
jgi:hypothetical protein